MIELAVPYARACTHALTIARKNDCSSAETVFVLQCAFADIGNDLHVPMRMQREAFPGCHPVFINYPQGAKAHEARIIVPVERKRVFGVEPAVVAATSFITVPN